MSSTYLIRDVAKIQRGSIDPRKHPDTRFELYNIPGFDNDKTPEQLVGADIGSSKSILPEQGVLFSKLNPRINRVWTFEGESKIKRIASTEFICLVPDSNQLDLEFLGWRLRNPNIVTQLPIATAAATKSRERIQPRTLLDLPIHLPPLVEQRQIVSILNRAAKIERLRTQAQERLRKFTPALFIKMFGDPATNPMGWERATLGELSQVQGGLQVTRKRKMHPLETPYLRVANVLRNRLDLREVKSMRVNEKELTRVQLMRGDLLIVEGHGNPSEIGRVAIWDGSIDGCVHQNHLIRVRPNPETLSPQFTCAFLNSSSGRQDLLRSGKTTSGLNTISVSDVKSCTLFTPPIDLQWKFTEFVNSASDLTSLANSGQRLATASSSSLMDRLLKDTL